MRKHFGSVCCRIFAVSLKSIILNHSRFILDHEWIRLALAKQVSWLHFGLNELSGWEETTRNWMFRLYKFVRRKWYIWLNTVVISRYSEWLHRNEFIFIFGYCGHYITFCHTICSETQLIFNDHIIYKYKWDSLEQIHEYCFSWYYIKFWKLIFCLWMKLIVCGSIVL